MSLFELGERRFQAAQAKRAAASNYETVRRTLKAKRSDVDADPAAIAALAEYDEAVAAFEAARREHGLALAADLKVRQHDGSDLVRKLSA
jgi:hypothetical protein